MDGRGSAVGQLSLHHLDVFMRFVGRPSRIDVRHGPNGSIHVGGLVAPFSSGTIELAAVRQERLDDSSPQAQ